MLQQDLLAFSSDAAACPNADTLRAHVLDMLSKAAPSDSALFLPLTPHGVPRPPVTRNRSPADAAHYRLYAVNPARYADWARRSRAITLAQRGAYRDTEVFSTGYRDGSPFYADIVRPQGISKQIVALVTFRGARTGSIHVCRHGRASDFTDDEVEGVRAALPAIALAQAALDPQPTALAAEPLRQLHSRLCVLSARERQIVGLVMRGLSNQEIADHCGTALRTVRNQMSRIFDKLGASNRAELASWATSVADPVLFGAAEPA
jgi:DNA-binding CsgD family transcriptional regulator